jgi:hypothetical protein
MGRCRAFGERRCYLFGKVFADHAQGGVDRIAPSFEAHASALRGLL